MSITSDFVALSESARAQYVHDSVNSVCVALRVALTALGEGGATIYVAADDGARAIEHLLVEIAAEAGRVSRRTTYLASKVG